MKIIHCDISTVELIGEDILYIDIKAETDFDMKDFYQLKEAARIIGNGKRFYNLVNVGPYSTPSHDAREASTSIEGSIYKLADAFVVRTYPQRMIGNFYMTFHKPHVPTRFFNDIDSAMNWINELREKNGMQNES